MLIVHFIGEQACREIGQGVNEEVSAEEVAYPHIVRAKASTELFEEGYGCQSLGIMKNEQGSGKGCFRPPIHFTVLQGVGSFGIT
jgi:hypothetical protein